MSKDKILESLFSKEYGDIPGVVAEYVSVLLDAVHNSLDFDLDLTSDTLPVLDHHVRNAQSSDLNIKLLLASTAGAYFGEVIRRQFGGEWFIPDEKLPLSWDIRFKSCPLAVSPVALAMDVISFGKEEDLDPSFRTAPARFDALNDAFSNTAGVTEDVYYSFAGRLDALHHAIDFLTEIEAKQSEEEKRPPGTFGDKDPSEVKCKPYNLPE